MKGKKDFGLYIQQKRKDKNLTQAELAEKLFISESAVSKWERGLTYPDITMISDICKVLDINEHEFITATNDVEYRGMKKSALRYKHLGNAIFYTSSIMYAVALLTCFIVNLAVDHSLTWFYIVASSLILAFTLVPTISRFIKRNRLLIISASILIATWLLLLTCSAYVDGGFFFISAIPVGLAYVMIFGPLFIHYYGFPRIVKKNNAFISITLDVICVIILLLVLSRFEGWGIISIFGLILAYVICMTPIAIKGFDFNEKVKGNKAAITIAISYAFLVILFLVLGLCISDFDFLRLFTLSLYFLFVVGFVVFILRYTNYSRKTKIGISLIAIGFAVYFTDMIIALVFNMKAAYAISLLTWSDTFINANVNFIVLVTMLIVGWVFIVIDVVKRNEGKKNE